MIMIWPIARSRFTLWLLLGVVAAFVGSLPTQAQATQKAIVGYVFPQNSLLMPGQVDAKAVTRLNYAFANIKDGRMIQGFDHDPENLALLVSLRKENPALTVLVSVGGWLWSGDFSEVSLTKISRKTFAQSAVEFIRQFNLDGLDIDWEFPGQPGAGHPFRAEDKQNFTALLREVRRQLDAEGRRTKRKLYLTIAAEASSEFIDHTQMRRVAAYVDAVNLMCYDYYEPGSNPITGHHAPLFVSPSDPRKVSADKSVNEFERAGVPENKLILGMPFYGHVWGNVAALHHGLFQPGSVTSNGFAPFRIIESTMLKSGFTRYWDADASVPYLYNPDTKTFVSYEDPQSVAAKCRYVLAHHLGGVMFWEYSNDPSGTLLGVINDTFRSATPQARDGRSTELESTHR